MTHCCDTYFLHNHKDLGPKILVAGKFIVADYSLYEKKQGLGDFTVEPIKSLYFLN